MKKSTLKDIHTGIQPIRVLKHNITHRLVDRNEELINELHNNIKLSKHIKYNITDFSIEKNQTPFIDENGVINIHETFLSYIWIVSYTIFVLYEEGIAIPSQIERKIPTHKNQNIDLIKLTKELFDYSKSLIKIYSEWDKDYFPNPEYFDESTDEGWYILRTNDLYVEIVNFILYHEIAHAEFEHIKKKKIYNLSNDDIKKLEIEADNRAIELMFINCRQNNVTEIAILIGLTSMLFFRKDLSGGKVHPNVDERINNFISIINPDDENTIWPMLVLFLKLWDEQFNHNLVYGNNYNNFKGLYYELLKQVN